MAVYLCSNKIKLAYGHLPTRFVLGCHFLPSSVSTGNCSENLFTWCLWLVRLFKETSKTIFKNSIWLFWSGCKFRLFKQLDINWYRKFIEYLFQVVDKNVPCTKSKIINLLWAWHSSAPTCSMYFSNISKKLLIFLK